MKNENEYIQTMRHFVANRFFPIRADSIIRKRIFFALITQKTRIFTDYSLTKIIQTKTGFLGIQLGSFG